MNHFNEADKSMLRVAYLLMALDGEITQKERETFRKVASSFDGFVAGSKGANDLLEEALTTTDKLLTLKKFYPEDEFITAFMTKVRDDCGKIKSNPVASRKAFAVWIDICLEDSDYSAIKRKALTALQQEFNQCPLASISTSEKALLISDDFLKEIEDHCRILESLQIQLDDIHDKVRKTDLKHSYNLILESLHELILNDNN